MNNLLQKQSYIISVLTKCGYFDTSRISKEILEFTKGNDTKIRKVVSQLQKQKPWEYIHGKSEFRGIEYIVNKNVLIPRIESEQIIDIVNKSVKKTTSQIIDVGTGSGAIAITLKTLHPTLQIVGVDISKKALLVAKRNAKLNKVDVKFRGSNLLGDIKIVKPTIVVANLPYIPTDTYEKLDKCVKEYEPKLALDGGKDGLDWIIKLIEQCKRHKMIKTIILEIDPSQKKNLTKYGFTFYKDFRGLIRFCEFNR